jgi:hypothetical protein
MRWNRNWWKMKHAQICIHYEQASWLPLSRTIKSFRQFQSHSMHYDGDQVKEDEIGRACNTNVDARNTCKRLVERHEGWSNQRERDGWVCNTNGRYEKCLYIFSLKKWRAEIIGEDGRIIIRCITKRHWIHLAHNSDKWRDLVNTVINF